MSELLKKPCSCGGNNPNCYMCGGWGYIDSVSESRTPIIQQSDPAKIKKPIKKKPKQKMTTKPKISVKMGDIFPKEISKIIKKEICKICGKEVKDNFEHIPCLFHNHKPTKVKIKPEPRRKCLFCNNKINKLSINSHIKKFHNKASELEKEKIRIALNLMFIDL